MIPWQQQEALVTVAVHQVSWLHLDDLGLQAKVDTELGQETLMTKYSQQ